MIFPGTTAAAPQAPEDKLQESSNRWLVSLAEMARELKTVSGTTEDEFLTIGGRLQDFYQRGTGISSLASAMVGEVAGDKVSGAMTGLEQMLNEMGRYVSDARNEIEGSSATLRETLSLLEQVSGPLSGFKKINKVLRMLGISTKIESARLGNSAAGFDTLASDVGELSVQVNDKAGVILTRREDLTRAIGQTLSGVLDSGAQQHSQVMGILDKTRTSLEALTSINGRCSSAVAGISAASEEVSRIIGEVVMSMQAHDIVRQQIEHVEETLTELGGRLGTGAAGADEVAVICELQVAQLRHASEELEGAVRTIIASLREVARKQGSLTGETRSMAGIADQAGESFFSEMQKDISVVTDALLESSQVSHNLCVAMNGVVDTVGEIAGFVSDIERIGEEIKLIALNAQIKSAYTGEEGAALGVLAEAIQRLSIDAIAQTSAVSDTLQAIIAVTQGLSNGICVESSALEQEVRDMVAGLTALVRVLQGVNESLHAALSQMNQAVGLLSHEIEQVTAGISVHQLVSRVLLQAVAGLDAIIAEARVLAPASASRLNLDELAGRYTMHSERRIHQALFKGTMAGVPEPSAAATGGELGDNVELF